MRFPKRLMRPRVVATALAVVLFGLSPIAIGAKHDLFDAAYRGTEPFASPHSSYASFEAPVPVRFLTPNAPEGNFGTKGPAQVGGDGVGVGAHPQPVRSDSGLPLILLGFGLVGGAVFVRRITPA